MRRLCAIVALLAGCSAPAIPSTSTLPEIHLRAVVPTTVDWRPGAVYAAQVQRTQAAIRYATAYAVAHADDYWTWADWPLWRCTKAHEGADRWGFVGGAGGRFRGAFAILDVNWTKYGGEAARRYPDASLAPPAEQIRGARLVRRAIGHGRWGGLRACGG